MKTYRIISIFVVLSAFLMFSPKAHAMTPSLSLSVTNNNAVLVTVNGDANSTVTLYYRNANSYVQSAGVIGSTNSYGYLSTLLGANNYSIPYNAEVYVLVNGIQSQTARWPWTGYNNGNIYNGILLNSANLTMKTGDTFRLTPQNSTGSYYISNNSNSYSASANVYNGNQITINAIVPGSSTITVCGYGNACATIYVTVQASVSYGLYPPYQYPYPSYPSTPSYNLPPIIYYPSDYNYNYNYYSDYTVPSNYSLFSSNYYVN